MKKLLAVALVLGLLASLALTAAVSAQQQSITVTLAAQSNSGVTGTATLTDLGGGRTRVVINVNPAGNTNMPAHIHEGTCANLNPAPKWPLNNVQNGQSTTEVNASLADIRASATAINLHKSPQEASVYVACGNIQMAAAVTALPRAGDDPFSGAIPLVALLALGLGLVAGGRLLRRRAA